ncbi:predicted protein [Plenodomus lingam JN3]|uniref:Predicted protein n=1 Tax=Leptosphaeria maculans (strain JN3 / isolate v23.1.3 / race Av1-4-5-6-7-8) TaxID=985895 RepID=E4ZIA0_LEPMJ|nr:predicted protein [Plenodomus lingam JN3]CBX90761.1 predicted protein [Plenodomus lingam JN3]
MSGSAYFRSIAQCSQAVGFMVGWGQRKSPGLMAQDASERKAASDHGRRPVALFTQPALGPICAPLLTGRPKGPTANPTSPWPEQTLIICSLHGLFWAADRDETSTAQQSGRGPAVSTRIPFESGVVPIHAGQSSGPRPRGQQSANSGARNARPSVDQHPFAKDGSLGTGAKHPSLTSRRYRVPSFGNGSLLQLANATVVLENGHAKQPDQFPSPLYPVSSNSVSPLSTVLLLPTLFNARRHLTAISYPCVYPHTVSFTVISLPHQSTKQRDLLSILLLDPKCGAITFTVRQQQTIHRQQRVPVDQIREPGLSTQIAQQPTTSQHPRRRSHDREPVDATSFFSGELQKNPRSDNSVHHTAYVAARPKDRPGHFPYLSVLEIRDLWRRREEAKLQSCPIGVEQASVLHEAKLLDKFRITVPNCNSRTPPRPPSISIYGLAAISSSQRQLIEDRAPVPAKRSDYLEANQQRF